MNKFSESLIELNKSLQEIKNIKEEFYKEKTPSDGIWFDEEYVSFSSLAFYFQNIESFNDKTFELKEQIYKLIEEYSVEAKNYENIYNEKSKNFNKLINDIASKAVSKLPEEVFFYTKAIRVHQKINIDQFIIDKKLKHLINDLKTLVFSNEDNVLEIQNMLFEEATSKMENEPIRVKNNIKGLLNIENFIHKEKPDLSKVQTILEVLSTQ